MNGILLIICCLSYTRLMNLIVIYEQNNENDTNAYSVHERLVYHFRRWPKDKKRTVIFYRLWHVRKRQVYQLTLYKEEIYNILCFVLFAALFIYAFIWVKYRLKLPLLKGIGVHQVMMMESPEYHRIHSDLKNEKQHKYGDLKKSSYFFAIWVDINCIMGVGVV